MTEIFTDVLQDPNLDTTYILVDALDECITDLPKLLRFVAKQSCASCRVKWIVSSRNWPDMPSWDLRKTRHVPKIAFTSLVRRSFWKAPHLELIEHSVKYNTLSLVNLSSIHSHTRPAAETHSAKSESLQHGHSLGHYTFDA